jgi:hypothetical protein
VPHGEVTAPANAGDGPPVAVLHPVGRSEPEAAVVATCDDHIPDARLIAVGQGHLRCRLGVIKTMRPGTAVEFGDELAGGGEHDRIKSDQSVQHPSGERILGGGGNVADVDAIMIEIEVERGRLAVAEGE